MTHLKLWLSHSNHMFSHIAITVKSHDYHMTTHRAADESFTMALISPLL